MVLLPTIPLCLDTILFEQITFTVSRLKASAITSNVPHSITNHTLVMTHYGAKLLPNNTIVGGTVAHIGQVYFDQSLLEQVEKTAPYNTNRQAWTKNANDPIISLGVANNDDPIINYSLLGSKIEDGVFGWITVGADVTNKRTVNQASWYSAQGGIKDPNAAGIGSFIFPGGNTGGAAGGGRKPPK